MRTIVALAFAFLLPRSSPAEPAIQAPRVLVLTTHQQLDVRDYHVDGRVVKATGLDGAPLSIRAEQVDLAASERVSTARQAEAERVLAASIEAQRVAEQEAADRAARHAADVARQKSNPRRGSMSFASNLGHDFSDSPTAPALSADGVPQMASGGDSGGNGLAGLRAAHKAKRAELAAKQARRSEASAERESLTDGQGHYKQVGLLENVARGAALLTEIDTLGRSIDTIQREIDGLELDFAKEQERLRRTGADAITFRGSIDQ